MLAVFSGCFTNVQGATSQDVTPPSIYITNANPGYTYTRDSPKGELVEITAQVFGPNYPSPFNATAYPYRVQVYFEIAPASTDAYVSPATVVDVDSEGVAKTVFHPPTLTSLNRLLEPGQDSFSFTIEAHAQRADDSMGLGYSSTTVYVWIDKSATPSPTDKPDNRTNSTSWLPCIIATATYGGDLAPQVVFMRSVRDDMIGQSATGKILVKGWNTFYYSWSPPVAQAISGSQPLRNIFSVALSPLLGSMYIVAVDYCSLSWLSPDLAAIHAFLLAALISIGIYFVLPGAVLWFGIKKIRRRLAR